MSFECAVASIPALTHYGQEGDCLLNTANVSLYGHQSSIRMEHQKLQVVSLVSLRTIVVK
eukprot:1143860-Pelagomonas_calceolata.AAC.3